MEKSLQEMIEDQKRTKGNRIINADIRYWDFFFLTREYNNSLNLTDEEKLQVAYRVHAFVNDIGIAIASSLCQDAPARMGNIEKLISNCVRKIKISLAKNDLLRDHFVAYWDYLLQTMKEEAVQTKNFNLNQMIGFYEQKFSTLQAA